MARAIDLQPPSEGQFVANITHFARALRRAGLPVGPGRVADAIRAVKAAGFSNRADFYWALHACFVSRPEHGSVFAQAFRLFWRDPQFLEHMMAMLLPETRGVQEEQKAKAAARRAAEALLDGARAADRPEPKEDSALEFDAAMTFSDRETLRHLDFEQMNLAEMEDAKRMLATLRMPVRPMVSRRSRAAKTGQVADWQNTMRTAIRQGGDIRVLAHKRRRVRWPNLVALCDISGSMAAYSRAVLHFLHATSNSQGVGWARVHGFTFGTQLTNITRHLQQRDVDQALALAGAEAQDWEGGTRIASCLRDFNRDWSRRVLGQGSVVLLITDGLDRGEPGQLAVQMQRLQRSSRRVIWLNPLLRWDGFAPKARGIREMLPHVDSFRAGHNIASLQALADALSRPDDQGEKARLMAMMEAG